MSVNFIPISQPRTHRGPSPSFSAVAVVAASILLTACSTGPSREDNPEELLERTRGAFEAGDLDRAAALAEKGLAGARDRNETWRFRLLRADVALQRWNAEKASSLLEDEPPPDAELASLALLYRARVCLLQQRYERALRWLDESEKAAEQAGAEAVLAQITLRRGYLQTALGNSRVGERLLVEAHQKALQSGDRRLQVEALGNLAFLSMNQSRYDLAVERFKTALQAAEQAGNLASTARILANLGFCYYQLGAYEAALRTLVRAEELSSRIDVPDRENSLGIMGNVHFSRGDFEKAIDFYQRALGLAQQISWKIVWLSNIAAAFIELEKWTLAEKFNNQALELIGPSEPGPLLYAKNNAGLIRLGTKRYPEAEQLFREIIEAGAQIDDPVPLWDGHAGLARLYTATNRPALAEKHYRIGLETIERVRNALSDNEWKISFKGHWIYFAQSYVDFLMQRGEIEKALEVAESNRAVVLTERVGDRYRPVHRSAAHFRKTAKALNAVFLSYWIAPQRSYVWLVSGDGIQSFEAPEAEQVKKLTDGYRNYLKRFDPLRDGSAAAQPLYEALLKPVEDKIPPSGNVIVVPDGPLHDLNFETLLAADRYWIEQVTLAVAPSLAALDSETSRPRRRESLLIMGDPLTVDDRYPELRGVKNELTAIRKHFLDNRVRTIVGQEAMPDAYRSSNPADFSLIHFAAHAEADSESPLNSSVILSPGGDRFRLFAREVATTPLTARVVTLSACRSAGARANAGAGLVGFAWAFLQAGSENVVAGLWEVDDRATALLMDGFYAELRKGQGPAQALRAAKLSLMKSEHRYSAPRYWAPLQVFTRSSPFAGQQSFDD